MEYDKPEHEQEDIRQQQITNRLATGVAALTVAGLAALFIYAAKADQERAAEQTNESTHSAHTQPAPER